MVLAMAPQRPVVWGFTEKVGEKIWGVLLAAEPITYLVTSVAYPGVVGGVWTVAFTPQPPNTVGQNIYVAKDTGGERLDLKGVLFGDVWICSGQSNMQFTLDMVILFIFKMHFINQLHNFRTAGFSRIHNKRTRQIIRYRATATLRRL